MLRELGAPAGKTAATLRAVATGIRAAVLGAVLTGTASAQTIVESFSGFASTSGLTINSSATVATTTDGQVLRLVPAATNKAGSAFTTTQINVTGFSTAFNFRLTSPGGISDGQETGADGLTFTLQTVGATSVGQSGFGLGYGGINHSVAVEFDTFFNSGYDPSNGGSNHVAVDLNGSVNSATNAVGVLPRFDNGAEWTAWIDYNGTTLEVRVSNTGVRPANPTLSQTINLTSTSYLGSSTAFVGFTAATGSAYANHDILDWAYSDTFVSGGISPVPEPATYELILLGAALVWLGRRRFRLAR